MGSLLRWTLTLLMFLYPLTVILFLGRRTMLVATVLVLGASLYLQKGWLPPRVAAVSFGAALQERRMNPHVCGCAAALPPKGAAVSFGTALQETS